MDSELKDILACPKCTGSLNFREDQQTLHCPTCMLAFNVVGGLPIMLIAEAQPLGSPPGSSTSPQAQK